MTRVCSRSSYHTRTSSRAFVIYAMHIIWTKGYANLGNCCVVNNQATLYGWVMQLCSWICSSMVKLDSIVSTHVCGMKLGILQNLHNWSDQAYNWMNDMAHFDYWKCNTNPTYMYIFIDLSHSFGHFANLFFSFQIGSLCVWILITHWCTESRTDIFVGN